jgi:acyl-CoA synthetase (NDP forming)
MKTHVDHAAIQRLFTLAAAENRHSLFEYEVYDLIRFSGSETSPKFFLLPKNSRLDPAKLGLIPGDRIVIKVVSPYILHKSDVGGVRIALKTGEEVLSTIRRMHLEIPERFAEIIERRPRRAPKNYRKLKGRELVAAISNDIQGVILCQYMHPDSEQFGNELLVSLRRTREFGMILTAGLGGTDTELYAQRFRKGQAIVSASTVMVDGETFFELFKNTISYKKLAGLTRGGKRIVTDEQLLECFSALIEVGNAYSPTTGSDFLIDELEINPFAFSNYLMMPLDGLCRFSPAGQPAGPCPIGKIEHLLHPATIGIAGISAKGMNIGRIILDNIMKNGFDRKGLVLIHPEAAVIDGISTIPELIAIRQKVDLLILAVNAGLIPGMIDDIIANDLAESVILIPGGLGEKKGQEQMLIDIRNRIAKARRNSAEKTAIFLGANSLGVLSHPGSYDSMFIPDSKLPKDRGRHIRRSALISQSGGYMITRMSKLSFLDPAYAVSIGNQIDLTAADFMKFFNRITVIKTIAFYMEGFTDLDGLEFARAVREGIPTGKEIIFYKAGRTQEGKTAMSGHTASIAGNYMVCESCISQAGAIVAETFTVFEGLLRLSCALHDKVISGNRLAAVSNAGYESVGIADNILGEDYKLEMATLSRATKKALTNVLGEAKLAALTDVNNPLDITPMAAEDVYEQVIAILLEDSHVDAIIIAIVPLTPILHTLPDEFVPTETFSADQSIIRRIARLNDHSTKPLVMVVDSGPLYDYMANAFEQQGLPVFRSADQAVWVLGKYIQGRLRAERLGAPRPSGHPERSCRPPA